MCVIYGRELYHYGIPGMKWGHRKARIETGSQRIRSAYRANKQSAKAAYKQQAMAAKSAYKQQKKAYKQTDEYKAQVKARRKKAVIAGAAVASTALAAYGAYKLNKFVKDRNMKIAYENGHKRVQKEINLNLELQRRSMANGAKGHSFKINADRIINDSMNRAKNDSFRTAARNVINYRRSGGNYGFEYNGPVEQAIGRIRG